MRRFATFLAVPLLCASAAPAVAGQASAQLHVGVTIGAASTRTAADAAPRFTWGAAAISVANAGFGSPVRLSVSADLYWFSAERNGATYRVAVSAATGQVVAVDPA